MAINPNVVSSNINTLEYTKFVEIQNSSTFPALTVTKTSYDDNKTITEIYNKTAVLTYDINAAQVNGQIFGDNGSVDAFGRLRVASSNTLFDAKFLYGKQTQYFDEVSSSITFNTGLSAASATFIPNDSLVLMQTASAGSYVIRQSYPKFNYQPGKSMQAMFTGVFAPETNIVKRVGMFTGLSAHPHTPADGLYLEVGSNGPAFVTQKLFGTANGTGSVPQSAWNIDQLNGYGPSGITLDFATTQLFTIDYEWLGVGRIRYGFFINGRPYYAHQVSNLNLLTAPYITSPSLPVRYELRQTGVGTGSMKQICSTVIVEGESGDQHNGTAFATDLSASIAIDATLWRPLMGIRISPTYPNLTALVRSINVINTGAGDLKYNVLFEPVIDGGVLNYVDISSNVSGGTQVISGLQFAQGVSTLSVAPSSGIPLYSNFVGGVGTGGGNQAPTAADAATFAGNLARLGTSIRGRPVNIVVVARGLTAATTAWGAITTLVRA